MSRDVVRIGGGVIGGSIARRLAANPDIDDSITAIERHPSEYRSFDPTRFSTERLTTGDSVRDDYVV